MRKDSTIERWPGWVEMGNYLKFPQLCAWEEAVDATKALKKNTGVGEFYKVLLPTAISFVEKWHIVGLNVDAEGNPINDKEGKPITVDYCNFPASGRLVAWIVECVSDLYTETNRSDPN